MEQKVFKKVSNKLQVSHYPQVPCKSFSVEVVDEYDAKKVGDILAEQHLFLFNEGMIPDYCNSITVNMWDEDEQEWVSYWNEEEMMEWDELADEYLSEQENN